MHDCNFSNPRYPNTKTTLLKSAASFAPARDARRGNLRLPRPFALMSFVAARSRRKAMQVARQEHLQAALIPGLCLTLSFNPLASRPPLPLPTTDHSFSPNWYPLASDVPLIDQRLVATATPNCTQVLYVEALFSIATSIGTSQPSQASSIVHCTLSSSLLLLKALLYLSKLYSNPVPSRRRTEADSHASSDSSPFPQCLLQNLLPMRDYRVHNRQYIPPSILRTPTFP